MERIFCKIKKIIILIIIITIAISPIVKAAREEKEIGAKFKFNGLAMMTYNTIDDARRNRIYKAKISLTKGDKVTLKEKDGNILGIIEDGENKIKYVKTNILNPVTMFEEISDEVKEPVVQPQQPNVKVSKIELEDEAINLYKEKGGVYKLKATVLPENAINKKIIWTSSNPKVATVDETGKVTWISVGTTTITATAEDNKNIKDTCVISATRLDINKTNLELEIGETSKLKVTTAISGDTVGMTWTSGNTKVAKVESDGTVKGLKEGTTTITGTAKNGITLECTVSVKKVSVKKVELSKTSVKIGENKTVNLKVTVTPSNATDKSVTWTSSNTKVAKVESDGTVKGLKAGTATITVKTADGGKTDTCTVTVINPVTGVSLNKTSLTVGIGKTIQLTPTITPSNATDKEVTWTSSDTKVATVNSKGEIKGIGKGTTTITVKTVEGGKTATCKVEVVAHDIDDEHIKILASVINAEQGDNSKQGQIAVGYVIKNRMDGTLTNGKLLSVLTASGQFASVQKYKKYINYTYTFIYNGTRYYTKPYTTQSLQVAKDVMNGDVDNPIGNRKYFWGTSYYNTHRNGTQKNPIQVGGNTFFNW